MNVLSRDSFFLFIYNIRALYDEINETTTLYTSDNFYKLLLWCYRSATTQYTGHSFSSQHTTSHIVFLICKSKFNNMSE